MSADLPSLIRKGLSDGCDEAGLPADGAPPPALTPAVSTRHRPRWLAPAAVALAVIAVLALLLVVPHRSHRPTPVVPAGSPPALPAAFAGPSAHVASVRQSPPGRTAALIAYAEVPGVGDVHGGQELAVATDARRYRTLTGAALLSSDGERAIVGGHNTVGVVDLRTGATVRTYPADGPTTPVAYSSDGRRAVYAETMIIHGEMLDYAVYLDLGTGHRTILSRAFDGPAAFSPDGRRVALQLGASVAITDLEGHVLSRFATDTERLAGTHAWSPDGRFLAINYPDDREGNVGSFVGIRFRPLHTGDTPPAPLSVSTSLFYGWSGTGRVVTFDDGASGRAGSVVVHDLTGHGTRLLATLPHEGGTVEDLATDLLPRLVTAHDVTPDYGP